MSALPATKENVLPLCLYILNHNHTLILTLQQEWDEHPWPVAWKSSEPVHEQS